MFKLHGEIHHIVLGSNNILLLLFIGEKKFFSLNWLYIKVD